jgi:hypothetical protein
MAAPEINISRACARRTKTRGGLNGMLISALYIGPVSYANILVPYF